MARAPASPLHPTACMGCDAPIWFARTTANGKAMPLDAKPGEDGNVCCYCDDRGTWHARVLRAGEQPLPYERRYHTHFETCSSPEAFRRRQRDAWRTAQAGLHRDQRNRRGARTTRQDAATGQPGLFRIPASDKEGMQ
jgi:hypothetical protein